MAGADIIINNLSPIIVIVGPTASGKSEFAIKLCKIFNGTIINFDSMQVYKELRILTARPDLHTEKIVPHKLYGYLSGLKRGSSILWRNRAIKEINLTLKSGRVPILVGGTGLYIKTLIDGISNIPKTDKKYKKESENILISEGKDAFYKRLKSIEPNLENIININDTQRLIRLHTVWMQTGKTLLEWQKADKFNSKVLNKFIKIRLSPNRDILRSNIKKRFYKMLDNNVMEEVKKIDKFDLSLPIMKAHGARELLSVFHNNISIEEAARITINHTCQYAKRQDTWFKHQYDADYEIINFNDNIDKYCSNILSLYKKLY